MSGKAMLTIVASTNAMNTPREETARTVAGAGARRRTRRRLPSMTAASAIGAPRFGSIARLCRDRAAAESPSPGAPDPVSQAGASSSRRRVAAGPPPSPARAGPSRAVQPPRSGWITRSA